MTHALTTPSQGVAIRRSRSASRDVVSWEPSARLSRSLLQWLQAKVLFPALRSLRPFSALPGGDLVTMVSMTYTCLASSLG